MAERVGTIFVELDLDYSKFERGQINLLNASKQAADKVETNWRALGQKSDTIFQAMANRAVLAYEKISKEATASAAEQFRAQSAMVAKINALNKEMARNPLYETLGIKSVKAFNEQKAAIIASYDTIKKSGTATAQDLVNIERAKNQRLRELNKEMVGDHEMSMAAMMRAILRFYAAYYVVSNAIRVVAQGVMSGIHTIDSLKVSTVAVAAQLTSMQGTTGNIVENYKQNLKYAEALNLKLMEIDAQSFANYEQIQLMNRAMVGQGVILDINKAKQVESFTALTNAVAMLTTGQDKTKQASQEIRALMTGQIRAGDMVAMQMDALIRRQGEYKGGLKDLVAEGQKHGDTLERMMPYLIGIVAASGDIQKTWESVGASIDTAWGILQRELFKDVYKDLVEGGQKAAIWVKDNAKEIADSVRMVYDTIAFGIKTSIALLTAFSATSVAKMAIAGDTAAWFALRWEAMAAKVTLSTSKMTLGFGSFGAAVAGYSFGQFLNKFEVVRETGVRIIYGLASSWDWFITKTKHAAEGLGTFFEILGSPTQFKTILEQSKKRLDVIAEEYKKRKQFNNEYLEEQLKAVSNEALAEAEAKSKIEIPEIKGTPEEDGKSTLKATQELNDRRLELEQKFQNEYTLATKTGLDKRLEEIKQNYESQKGQAKKYGADTTLLEKKFLMDSKKATDEYFEDLDDSIEKFFKEVDDAKKKVIETNVSNELSLFFGDVDKAAEDYRKTLKDAEDRHKKMMDNIQDISSDAVYDIINDWEDGWSGLMDSMKTLFLKTMAELMAKQYVIPIIMPIVQSVLGGATSAVSGAAGITGNLSSILGLSKLSSTAGSFLNTPVPFLNNYSGDPFSTAAPFTIGNALSGAGFGALGYSTIGSMVGLPQGGYSGLGSAVGGAAGSFLGGSSLFAGMGALGGPLGIALGALSGGVLGSLFGKEDEKVNYSGKGYLDYGSFTHLSSKQGAIDLEIRKMFNDVLEANYQQVEDLMDILPDSMASSLDAQLDKALIDLPKQNISRDNPEAGVTAYLTKLQTELDRILGEAVTKIGFESEEAFQAYVVKLQAFGELSSQTIGSAFSAALNTGDWDTFERSVQDGIYKSVFDGIINALTSSEAFKNALRPLFTGIDEAMTAAMKTGTFSASIFTEKATPYLTAVTSTIQDISPAFQAIAEAMETVRDLVYNGEYEDAANGAAGATDELTESLKELSMTVAAWLADLQVSDLSPVSSAETWMNQYASMKAAASIPGAESETVTDFLSFATNYLQFMQSYGTSGSYSDIYDAVVSDVMRIQAGILSQIPGNASGGLTNGLSWAGESGREWVVPTYEPQRSSFLKDVGADPETIGKIIAQAITQSGGGSTGGEIKISVQIDGHEIGRAVAKEMKTNPDLISSVRSLN